MYADTAEAAPKQVRLHGKRVWRKGARVRPFDVRFAWEKRRRALVAVLTEELARQPSARDVLLINNAAAATVRLEQLQDKVTRGQFVDDEALNALTNTVMRLLSALGIKSAPAKPLTPSVADYLTKFGNGDAA